MHCHALLSMWHFSSHISYMLLLSSFLSRSVLYCLLFSCVVSFFGTHFCVMLSWNEWSPASPYLNKGSHDALNIGKKQEFCILHSSFPDTCPNLEAFYNAGNCIVQKRNIACKAALVSSSIFMVKCCYGSIMFRASVCL